MDKKSEKPFKSIFRKVPKWQDLWFYQKSEVLYQMTYIFCERFLPQYGDRTVDQMVQAARSGKQNIVEGSEDGKTSTEMELKLLNVARASIGDNGRTKTSDSNRCRTSLRATTCSATTSRTSTNGRLRRWLMWGSRYAFK